MAEKLWDLANLVTGFAVVQSIATIFSVANGSLKDALNHRGGYWTAIVLDVFFTVAYIVIIFWCEHNGAARASAEDARIWPLVTLGRAVAVAAFGVILLITLFGSLWSQKP